MSQLQPKVSIVLPTHNGSRYLRTSIESCLQQTFRDFELIIVDDASTDETPEIIKSYKDPRIKYIRNHKNQRLPGSLNIGFSQARGEYLTWTSDDNIYMTAAIENMVNALESQSCDFVYADNFIFKNDDLKDAEHLILEDYTRLPETNCVRACFLYTRRVMRHVGLYDTDMELIEDYDYWVRVSRKFSMHHLKEPLYYYRYHARQLYTARNKEIKIIELLFKFKYGFMSDDMVEWHLRNLGPSSYSGKIISFLVKKPQVRSILRKYKEGLLSFTAARKFLHDVVYDSRTSRKKTFVFLRRLPPPPEGEWGGLEELMFDWFERINYEKASIYVAVTQGWKERFLKESLKYGIPLQIIEMPFHFNDGMMRRFLNMWTFLKNLKPDGIVYFQGHFMEFSIAEVLAGSLLSSGNVFMHENLGSLMPPRKSSKRHFGFLPGLGLWWQLNRFLVNIRAYAARKILVVSGEIKNRYVSWWSYPQTQISVMYHGTDTKRFASSLEERRNIRARLNISPSDIVIITTARFSKVKCLDRVIKAFDVLSKEFSHLRLLMAGSGPLEMELKQLAASLESAGRITFLGLLEDPSDYLKASDIFVLSSDNEGLSLSLLEAMSAGLICVSTDCAGSSEAIINERLGLIVERSAEGVARGLKRILELPKEKQQEISGTAAGFIRENFDINTNVQKVFKTIGLVN